MKASNVQRAICLAVSAGLVVGCGGAGSNVQPSTNTSELVAPTHEPVTTFGINEHTVGELQAVNSELSALLEEGELSSVLVQIQSESERFAMLMMKVAERGITLPPQLAQRVEIVQQQVIPAVINELPADAVIVVNASKSVVEEVAVTVGAPTVTVETHDSIEHTAHSDTTVLQETYRTTITTTRTPTTLRTTVTPVVTTTYSNGSTSVEYKAPAITESITYTDSVETSRELVNSQIVEASIVNIEQYTVTVNTEQNSDPVVTQTITYNTVATDNGDGTVTRETYKLTLTSTTVTRTELRQIDTYEIVEYSTGYVSDPRLIASTAPEIINTEQVVTSDTTSELVATEIVAASSAEHMGTPSNNPMFPTDANAYLNIREYQGNDMINPYDDHLFAINAHVAHSRGWTGLGTKIAILDTGVDVDHEDLQGAIFATRDFTGTSIADGVGHGTHVAGIAGARRNDFGMVGVAPESQLLIAKVTNTSGYSFSLARQALAWADSQGAVVANISANASFGTATFTDQGNGTWTINHEYYQQYGYYGFMETDIYNWKAAMGNEMVVVNSAGNHGYKYAAYPGIMATAVDADGELILGGRMLVVGNWDIRNERIVGNEAGHICLQWNADESVCNDPYRIKDFFIMAPGNSVYSTTPNDRYNHMSGTSMAAPQVAGAVAVVAHMWPHMTGSNIVQLLLETANKNLRNYDENRHGQGLLDLDRATQPVGVTGIPVTGRTSGSVESVSGVSTAPTGDISSVMVLDSYERDFYIDARQGSVAVDTRSTSAVRARARQLVADYYAAYATERSVSINNVNVNFMDNNTEQFSVSVDFEVHNNVDLRIGYAQEKDTWLGYTTSGMWGNIGGAQTVYATAFVDYELDDSWSAFGSLGIGATRLRQNSDWSMLTDASTMYSASWEIGLDWKQDVHNAGFVVSQPVAIVDGSLSYSVPSARTVDGRVVNSDFAVDMSNRATEYNVGAYYNLNSLIQNVLPVELNAWGEHRVNYRGISGNTDNAGGANIRIRF